MKQWQEVTVSKKRKSIFDGYGLPTRMWGLGQRRDVPCLSEYLDIKAGQYEMSGISAPKPWDTVIVETVKERVQEMSRRYKDSDPTLEGWVSLCQWDNEEDEKASSFIAVIGSVPFNLDATVHMLFNDLERERDFSLSGAELSVIDSDSKGFMGHARIWSRRNDGDPISLASKAAVLLAGSQESWDLIWSGADPDWLNVAGELKSIKEAKIIKEILLPGGVSTNSLCKRAGL